VQLWKKAKENLEGALKMEIDYELRRKTIWELWDNKGYTIKMLSKTFGISKLHIREILRACRTEKWVN